MKYVNYVIDHDYLTIRILGKAYQFKIDDNAEKATQTIKFLFQELRQIETQFGHKSEKVEPIVKILLASLNIADQYLDLQSKFNEAPPATNGPETHDEADSHRQHLNINCPKVNTIETEYQGTTEEDDYLDDWRLGNDAASEDTLNHFSDNNNGEHRLSKDVIETVCDTVPNREEWLVPNPPPQPQPIHTRRLLTYNTEQQPDVSLSLPAEPDPPIPARPSSETNTFDSDPWSLPVQRINNTVGSDSSGDDFTLPPLSFLKPSTRPHAVDRQSIRNNAEMLEKKLAYFGIKGEVMEVTPGPIITTFEYKPAPGVKISKIVNLADDIALALSAISVRIVAPIPGKDVIGIEIPNQIKSIVPFRDIVDSDLFLHCGSKIPICLGKDIIGQPVVVELDKMPHLLIAGATGTGKSVALNAMITSILFKAAPNDVKLLMIDPKRIELSLYNNIPHLLTPVVTDMNKANNALSWMVREMERRYDLLAEYQVRNIRQFNQKLKTQGSHSKMGTHLHPLPYIVVIIDELADLMMTSSRDVELSLTRLAQMARAAGIHLIVATQRPSVDVLTGIIKANFPTRISFQVSSKTDSRTIIDSNGAETLLGNGDMLFVPPGTARLKRVHGTFISESELLRITDFLKNQQSPDYFPDVTAKPEEELYSDVGPNDYDEKYNEALEFIYHNQQASISSIQRALRIGYNRAARIIDSLEKNGIVGPSDGAKPRKVIGPINL